MAKKKRKERIGIVYSTSNDYEYQYGEDDEQLTLPNNRQDLRVMLDKKLKGGKQVTLITGFKGREDDLKDLEKKLKKICGTGGSSKEGDVLIQGDFREKILAYLLKEGFKAKKAGG